MGVLGRWFAYAGYGVLGVGALVPEGVLQNGLAGVLIAESPFNTVGGPEPGAVRAYLRDEEELDVLSATDGSWIPNTSLPPMLRW